MNIQPMPEPPDLIHCIFCGGLMESVQFLSMKPIQLPRGKTIRGRDTLVMLLPACRICQQTPAQQHYARFLAWYARGHLTRHAPEVLPDEEEPA